MNRLIRNITIIVFSFSTLIPLSGSELFEANIFRAGTDQQELLFVIKNQIKEDQDGEKLTHQYFSPQGELMAEEKIERKNSKTFNYNISFFPWEEFSFLRTEGEKMLISFQSKDKEKSKYIDYKEGLLFGPTQQDFIQENLENLLKGEKIHFLLPVPEYSTTAHFHFKKVEGTDYEKEGHSVIKLESDNLFIRLIIESNYFVIENETGRIKEIYGPSLLKGWDGNKWQFLEVEVYFNY
jgi:hypothetical protein